MAMFILVRKSEPWDPYHGTIDTIDELLAFMEKLGPITLCRIDSLDTPILVIMDTKNTASPTIEFDFPQHICQCAEPQTLDDENCIRCNGKVVR